MKGRLSTLVAGAAILFLAANLVNAKEEKEDKDKLQGTWQVVGGEAKGQELPEEAVKALDFTMTIKGEKYTAKSTQEDEEGTIKLDPKKDPKTIEFHIESGKDKGKKQLGIYALDGDTLKICAAKPGSKERPKEIKTTAGDDFTVLVLKRKGT
jgi:uncharacterized protein (TIGR03067 family)